MIDEEEGEYMDDEQENSIEEKLSFTSPGSIKGKNLKGDNS